MKNAKAVPADKGGVAAVDAAEEALSQETPGTPMEDLMANAGLTTGALDPQAERPAALVVEGTTYMFMPEIDGYASEEGELLDLKTQPAVKALFAWRRERQRLKAVEAAQQERDESGPDDLHLFHVERERDYGEFEQGRRWVAVKDLQPGIHGNEGVQLSHGVVVRYESGAKGDDGRPEPPRLLHFRITHYDDESEVASLEPGERLRDHAVVFYPKPYVYTWLGHVAQVEGTTVERWVNKQVHQAYAISDIRTAQLPGVGMAGKVGANPELAKDLQAGRAAKAV